MKKTLQLISCMLAAIALHAQKTPDELLKSVWAAQKQLNTVAYSLQRSDTFTTGQTRTITGNAEIKMAPDDKWYGFTFWGKRDSLHYEAIYDGRIAYTVDHEKKEYDAITKQTWLPKIDGSPGGQILFKDLVKLDTSYAIGMESFEDADNYWLKLNYADNKEYDVKNRYKLIRIDKKSMLPVETLNFLTVLDKKQTTHLKVRSIRINEAGSITHIKTDFLEKYKQEERAPRKDLANMVGSDIKHFTLKTFDDKTVSSESFKGRIVLLDFWEVWCGPCIASMPKVQSLYETYGSKGLAVYGIVTEKGSLDAARKMAKMKQASFPMLIGDEKITADYAVTAIPLYVLINKQGKIAFVSEGYTSELEVRIKKEMDAE